MIELPMNAQTLIRLRGELVRWAKECNHLFGALNGWRKHEPHEVFTYSRDAAVREAREACNVSDAVREDAVLAMMGWDFDPIDRAAERFTRMKETWMKPEHLTYGGPNSKGFGISPEGEQYMRELSTPVSVCELDKEPLRSMVEVSKKLNGLKASGALPNLSSVALGQAFGNFGEDGTVVPTLLFSKTMTLATVGKSKRKDIKKPHEILTDGTTKQDS